MSEASHKYETKDLSPSTLAWCAAGVVVSFFAIFILIWLLMAGLQHASPRSELASRITAPTFLPPPPRLQTSPQADLKEMRTIDAAELQTYGWIDRKAGIVRIPIERAIDLTATRGLPARRQATPPPKQEGAP